MIVTHRDEVIYDREVVVTLVPDPAFKAEVYNEINVYEDTTKTTLKVTGKKPAPGGAVTSVYSLGRDLNRKSNTYYTLNGKDPVRTKSNLYTGSFKIKRNTSGDNVVLKTRSYAQGYKSEVRTVNLRIVGKSKYDI